MATIALNHGPRLFDERGACDFRKVFGQSLSRSTLVETAILRIRLGAVDLKRSELSRVGRFRVLVAEVNAQTIEEEAHALIRDPEKRGNLDRIMGLLGSGKMEIRSAPLGGWSPDFSVFCDERGPGVLLLGLHWFRHPFPHRGPVWTARFGASEARVAHLRFLELWNGAHEIGPAVRGIMERSMTTSTPAVLQPEGLASDQDHMRQGESPSADRSRPVDTSKPPG